MSAPAPFLVVHSLASASFCTRLRGGWCADLCSSCSGYFSQLQLPGPSKAPISISQTHGDLEDLPGFPFPTMRPGNTLQAISGVTADLFFLCPLSQRPLPCTVCCQLPENIFLSFIFWLPISLRRCFGGI